jgi:hypothetical protein
MPNRSARQVNDAVNGLKQEWNSRDTEVSKWYRLIRLENDLAQPNMESVISNDPRTSLDMASWLLKPRTPKFLASNRGLDVDEIQEANAWQQYALREYERWDSEGESELYGNQIDRCIQFMLATGWYALISMPMMDGTWRTETWNPMSVWPEYDSAGHLIKVARRYVISGAEANSKVHTSGWIPPSRAWTGNVAVNVLWEEDLDGVWQTISIGTHLVKPTTFHELFRIPVYTGPVAGLPDDGSINGSKWRGEIGQSVITPILDVQKNYDKMLTYMQQLLRDTANPRILERVRGSSVVTSEQWYGRGAIFTVEPDEDIRAIQPPVLPPEMRAHLFDMRAMTQRGTFSDTAFGTGGGAMSSVLMTQIISASQRVLYPFHSRLKAVLGNIATMNIAHMQRWGIGRDGILSGLMENINPTRLNFNYDITIPGDFVQRASQARILNPEFRLSQTTLYDVLFPEVQNAVMEQGKLQSEDAMRDPIVKTIITINELSQAAEEAKTARDDAFAALLEKAIQLLQNQIFQTPDTAAPGSNTGAVNGGFSPQGVSPVMQELLAGR